MRRVLARLKAMDRVSHDRLAADYLDENGQLRIDPIQGTDEDDRGQLGLFETDD
jgi:hypothetical protein